MSQQQRQLPLNVDLSKMDDIKCSECGALEFQEATRLKTIPGMLVGEKENQLVPIQVFACIRCGNVNEQFLPDIYDKEKKAESNNSDKEDKKESIIIQS